MHFNTLWYGVSQLIIFLKGIVLNLLKKFKKINNKGRQRLEFYTFLKNYQKIFISIKKIFIIIDKKKKKIHPAIYIKGFFLRPNINLINLSLDELRLIAQNRNIRDFENKSKKDLIKALKEPKPKTRTN